MSLKTLYVLHNEPKKTIFMLTRAFHISNLFSDGYVQPTKRLIHTEYKEKLKLNLILMCSEHPNRI